MVWRVYIMPAVWDASVVGPASTGATGRTPAYAGRNNPGEWAKIKPSYYGWEPVVIVAVDATPAQHAAIQARSPLTTFPADLDAAVTAGNRAAVVASIEQWGFPGDWITAGMTSRQILQRLLALCELSQIIEGRNNARILPPGVTLATTLGELTTAQRRYLREAAESRGWDVSWATGTTTVREFLRRVSAQNVKRMRLGPEEFDA